MKSIHYLLVLLLISINSLFAQTTQKVVLMADDFSTPTLGALWNANLPYADSAVSQVAETGVSYNRGHITTVGQFDGNLEISFRVKLTGGGNSANLVWKTSGLTTGDSGHCPDGLVLGIYNESQSLVVCRSGGTTYTQVFLPIPLDTWMDFDIVDQNGVVSVFKDGVEIPGLAYSYDSVSLTSNGRVAFYSRESRYVGNVNSTIDDVIVSQIVPVVVNPVVEPAVVEPVVVASEPVVVVSSPSTSCGCERHNKGKGPAHHTCTGNGNGYGHSLELNGKARGNYNNGFRR
jgi:hypothetical protein